MTKAEERHMVHSFIGSLSVHTPFAMLMKLLWMLLLSVIESSSSISTVVGHSVTFSCVYDVINYGALPVCWGRGQIPTSGCGQRLLSTDGHRVMEDSRASSRYRLLGRLDSGDVSLTILNVSVGDAGTYGCRVEVPGWFNDHKHHYELTVVPKPTSSSSSSSSSPLHLHQSTAACQTTGHMTSNDTHLTVAPESVNSSGEGAGLTVLLLSVISGLVLVVAAVGIFIMAARRRRIKKLLRRNNVGAVRFSLSSRGSAMENIYQVESDEFDYCPYDHAH